MPTIRTDAPGTTPYRAGIIGCGRIGCGFDDDPRRGYVSTHAGAYVRTPGISLVALADLDRAKLARYADKFDVKGRYESYQEMLAHEDLDILSVCTWNDTHREIVEGAAGAKVRAIFCEKPIASTLTDADDMIQRCAAKDIILVIDHQRRFDPFHQQVRSYIEEGRLGRVQHVTCYYTAGVANSGSHLFDLLRFFFGDPVWVQGAYSQNLSTNPQDPNVDGWLQFRDGLLVAVQACDVRSYLIFEVNILGTLGRLRIVSSGFDLEYEHVRESPRFSGYNELFPAPPPLDSSGPREFMLRAVEHLIECLRYAKEPISSGLDGRRALEIICALRESAEENGRRIELPLQESRIRILSR